MRAKSICSLIFVVSLFLATGPAIAGTGGPDAFGYVWIDSDEPGGPTYSWVDITTRGTQLALTDDSNLPITMPFSFDFYGNSFSGQMHVCSNGWASFTSTMTSYYNYGLPSSSAPENLLAVFWDDMNPTSGGQVWWFGNSDSLIVAWIGVPHYSNSGSFTFQIILTSDYAIHYQYDSMGNGYPTNEATIGIQNATQTIGLQVAYNQNYVHNQLAVDFLLPRVMMRCQMLTPVMCRGKNLYFSLTVTNNTQGNCSGTLTFTGYSGYSCDPGNALVAVPRAKTYAPGETVEYYFFKVPNSAAPGQYSTSIGGTLCDVDLFCCMNVDIVQCQGWRIGGNTNWELVEAERPEVGLPTVTSLVQNYPNPFNAETNISFSLAEAGDVTLNVYDITGRLVATLVNGYQEAGEHVAAWDASNVSSGVYFYKLTAGDYTATKSMNLLK
jgi:hypothetical protein